jgi:hypothetical protein
MKPITRFKWVFNCEQNFNVELHIEVEKKLPEKYKKRYMTSENISLVKI